jgi:hypothetical protein
MEQDLNISDLVRWYGCDPHGIVVDSSLGVVLNRGDHKFKSTLFENDDYASTADYISWTKDQYRVYLFDRKEYLWVHVTELELVKSNKKQNISSY